MLKERRIAVFRRDQVLDLLQFVVVAAWQSPGAAFPLPDRGHVARLGDHLRCAGVKTCKVNSVWLLLGGAVLGVGYKLVTG